MHCGGSLQSCWSADGVALLQALKERLVERANIIQARHDAETATLVKRQVRDVHTAFVQLAKHCCLSCALQPDMYDQCYKQNESIVCVLMHRLTSSATETR